VRGGGRHCCAAFYHTLLFSRYRSLLGDGAGFSGRDAFCLPGLATGMQACAAATAFLQRVSTFSSLRRFAAASSVGFLPFLFSCFSRAARATLTTFLRLRCGFYAHFVSAYERRRERRSAIYAAFCRCGGRRQHAAFYLWCLALPVRSRMVRLRTGCGRMGTAERFIRRPSACMGRRWICSIRRTPRRTTRRRLRRRCLRCAYSFAVRYRGAGWARLGTLPSGLARTGRRVHAPRWRNEAFHCSLLLRPALFAAVHSAAWRSAPVPPRCRACPNTVDGVATWTRTCRQLLHAHGISLLHRSCSSALPTFSGWLW